MISKRGSNQPYMHGYQADRIKNWQPETDTYARFFRSRVPLAKRIAPFPSTQVHPHLSSKPQVMNLSANYDKENITFKYNDTYCCNLLKFWQYTDFYGAWDGLPVEGSPEDTPVFGVVNLPNPAYTDAAHRNGVLSLGCWFWPREEEAFSDLVERKADGTFPVADKLIEMALYFGFDGYFVNQEASISTENAHALRDMMTYLKEQAPDYFHFQWYDTIIRDGNLQYQNQFNKQNAPWLLTENNAPIFDSMFINYAWNLNRLEQSHQFAKQLGLDPYRTLFPGTENDKYGYNPPYDTRHIFPESAELPYTGWGLFGTDFVWNRYKNKFDPDDQQEVLKRERRYWSGPLEDPTDPVGRTLYQSYKDPFHAVDPDQYKKWDGVAHYIPARSVINACPFITRFNTGHGRAFFLNGGLAAEKEWNNASIQDILPTWQWWIQRFDSLDNPLPETAAVSERPLTVDYDYSMAYDGGSCLKISGVLEPDMKTVLRLFKTKVVVHPSIDLAITYKTAHESQMEVGLIFEDEPAQFVWMKVDHKLHHDWHTQLFSLDIYKGRTIAAIGLRFSVEQQTTCKTHIGELALTTEAAAKPDTPSAFTIDQAYVTSDSAELFLSWAFNPEGIWYYDIYHLKADNQREMIGRIYDEVYYVKSLDRPAKEKTAILELVAVNHHGVSSTPCRTTLDWPD